MPVSGFAATAARAPLLPFSFEPPALGENDVEIEVSHCGVCHSDVSLIDNDWGFSQYPMVPGHEVVGQVSKVGSAAARRFRIGAQVGVGWQSGCCGECEYCLRAEEHLCKGQRATCVHGFGGYAEVLRVNARFAVPLSDDADPQAVAPLLCGGITVYTPFIEFDVRPSMRVAVLGIGGLGHLALQFGRALGCEMTALSGSPDKEAEAREYGAHEFLATGSPDFAAAVSGRFDFILSTASAALDMNLWLGALKPRGTFCIVGVPSKPLSVQAFGLIQGQRRIVGSPIGSPSRISEMLDLAQRAGVAARTEHFAMSDVNAALDRVRANQARYRIVLAR